MPDGLQRVFELERKITALSANVADLAHGIRIAHKTLRKPPLQIDQAAILADLELILARNGMEVG